MLDNYKRSVKNKYGATVTKILLNTVYVWTLSTRVRNAFYLAKYPKTELSLALLSPDETVQQTRDVMYNWMKFKQNIEKPEVGSSSLV